VPGPRSSDGIRLRRATLADLPLLVAHRDGMWRGMGRGSPTQRRRAREIYRGWARRMMRDRRLVGFIAETREGRAAASGCVWLPEPQPRPETLGRPVPYLMSMFTEPEFRGRGLATRIVREAMRWSRDHGHSRLTLHAARKARPLYRRLGFERGWEMRVDLAPSRAARPRRRKPGRRPA
jgi:GNAT superfamily N-acetyltransferase